MSSSRKVKASEDELRDICPAMTPQAKQEEMIHLAVKEAERRIKNHTASNALLCHYLRLDADREKNAKELQMMDKQMELADAKIKEKQSNEELRLMMEEAIKAMQIYSGQGDE